LIKRIALIGAGALLADVLGVDPQHVVAEDVTFHLERLPPAFDGFKITQLSDIHYGFTIGEHYLHRAIEISNEFMPDLVVVTGDFVNAPTIGSKKHKAAMAHDADPCGKELSKLRSRLGTLACMGNHDAYTNTATVMKLLEKWNIPTLHNRSVSVENGADRLWISGVGDVLHGHAQLDVAVSGLPPDEVVILLAHEPDYADGVATYPHRIDVQLSGHSHGGQVRLPFIGATVLPPLAKKYPQGWRKIGDLQLYTNRGLGTTQLPVRFLCPPEVTRIVLRRK
jgi:predicted MPP superfamily phosphohydrolase